MVRVKRGRTTRKKHKKIIKSTRGMRGIRRTSVKKAKEALMKASSYATRDRRAKKREFRKLWIIRLGNALREKGFSYSSFINQLKKKKIELDRKILAELAVSEPEVFDKLISEIKKPSTFK